MNTQFDIDVWLERQTNRLDRRFMNDDAMTQAEYDAEVKELSAEHYRMIQRLYVEELNAPPVTQF